MANNNEQLQKIFVGGLTREVDEECLSEAFGTHGRIIDVSVLRDGSGRSRGFGFVIFEDSVSVDNIMKAKKAGTVFHVSNATVEVKRALPKVDRTEMRDRASSRHSTSIGIKKVFVGGLAGSTCTEDLEEYFAKFGKVLEASVLMDKITGRSRGFGFVVFEDEDTADKVCALKDHTINGKLTEVRKAEPRSALMNKKDREQAAAMGYRNQTDNLRPQQVARNPTLDVGSLNSAIQVLNSLQNLVSAAQVQQMLGQNAASLNQNPVYGAQQFAAPNPNIAVQNPIQNQNQNNILQLLQTALSNQSAPTAMPAQPVATPNSNQLSNLLGSSGALGGLSGSNVNALGLLNSLVGLGQQNNQVKQESLDPQVASNSSINSAATSGTPVSRVDYMYDDVYGASTQTSSGYGPVRYPPGKADSKSYRPY